MAREKVLLPEKIWVLKNTRTNRFLGPNGLPADFYKTFFFKLGKDLLDVFREISATRGLPVNERSDYSPK